MSNALDHMTEIIAHHVDSSAMRVLIPTLLFLKHANQTGLVGNNHSTWESLRQNQNGLDAGPLLQLAADEIIELRPQLADALPDNLSTHVVAPRETAKLIDLIEQMPAADYAIGDAYQYILRRFTPQSARHQGQFFTPPSVVELIARLIHPLAQSVYDPAAGAATLLTQVHRKLATTDRVIPVYGQEINPLTVRLARMNLIIQNADADVKLGNTLEQDAFPDLLADAVVANPPFNAKYDHKSKSAIETRWRFGEPPANNANFAWLQHCLHHTSTNGSAVVIMPPSSLNSGRAQETTIRVNMVENHHVHAIISLPTSLFMTTQVPIVMWVMAKTKLQNDSILMIDAASLGTMVDRTQRALTPPDIDRIADTYRNWQNHPELYQEQPGFTRAVNIEQVRKSAHSLNPASYVGTVPSEEEEIPFALRFQQLAAEWQELRRQDEILNQRIDQIFTNLRLDTPSTTTPT